MTEPIKQYIVYCKYADNDGNQRERIEEVESYERATAVANHIRVIIREGEFEMKKIGIFRKIG